MAAHVTFAAPSPEAVPAELGACLGTLRRLVRAMPRQDVEFDLEPDLDGPCGR